MSLLKQIESWRERRWLTLCVVNLRIMIGFGFLPAGLKKVLGQPFTDPESVGAFHDFLHAFLQSGALYRFVGVMQLIGALLLMTQRFALLGALILLPILAVIAVFVWSTAGLPTITTVSLMLCGVVFLTLWDTQKWIAVVASRGVSVPQTPELAETRLWQRAGFLVALCYFASCLWYGGVYRPRGAEWSEPAFYVMPLIALIPVATWFIERRRRRP